jgi:hypothetical protein
MSFLGGTSLALSRDSVTRRGDDVSLGIWTLLHHANLDTAVRSGPVFPHARNGAHRGVELGILQTLGSRTATGDGVLYPGRVFLKASDAQTGYTEGT